MNLLRRRSKEPCCRSGTAYDVNFSYAAAISSLSLIHCHPLCLEGPAQHALNLDVTQNTLLWGEAVGCTALVSGIGLGVLVLVKGIVSQPSESAGNNESRKKVGVPKP